MAVEILATTGFSIDILNPGSWDTAEPVHQVDKSGGRDFFVSAQLIQLQSVNRGEVIVELLDANNNVVATARLSVATITGKNFTPLIAISQGSSEIIRTSFPGAGSTGQNIVAISGSIVPGTAKWQTASVRCSMHGLYAADTPTEGFRMWVHTETLTVLPPPPEQAPLSLIFKGVGSLTWNQTFSFKA